MKIVKIGWEETLPVRHEVLWPNYPKEFCKVDGDEQASHFGVIISGEIKCVASIYIDGKSARLRKFATIDEFQGKGIGSQMISFLIKRLRETGVEYFWFDARESAVGFYRRFGFASGEQRFFKNHIAYFKMHMHFK